MHLVHRFSSLDSQEDPRPGGREVLKDPDPDIFGTETVGDVPEKKQRYFPERRRTTEDKHSTHSRI